MLEKEGLLEAYMVLGVQTFSPLERCLLRRPSLLLVGVQVSYDSEATSTYPTIELGGIKGRSTSSKSLKKSLCHLSSLLTLCALF